MEQDEGENTRGEGVLSGIGGRRVKQRQLEKFGRGQTRGGVKGLVLRSVVWILLNCMFCIQGRGGNNDIVFRQTGGDGCEAG